MDIIAIVSLMVIGLCSAQKTTDYCNVSTCRLKKTTLCNLPLSTWGSKCGSNHAQSSALSKDDQKTVVDLHNQLRSNIALGKVKDQPGASNMRTMYWDDELSQMAQAWAQQCTLASDSCRDVDRFGVGQNQYQQMFGKINVTSGLINAINTWYSEVKFVTIKHVDNFNSPGPGGSITLYTQLMWADTYLVGCAAANLFKSLFVICNYGPRSNNVRKGVGTVYKRGPAGTACPVGTRKDSTGLCALL